MTFRLLLALSLCAGLAVPAHAQPTDGVYVVAAIQRLHATEPDYGYPHLRRIIDAVKPDVVVLEVRPDEAAERKDTPGRPEYPNVVWPWLADHPLPVISMEPGGRTFAQMTGEAGAMFERFAREKPAEDAYMTRLGRSLSVALQAHWKHPADAHDRFTADLVRAEALAQANWADPRSRRGRRPGTATWSTAPARRSPPIRASGSWCWPATATSTPSAKA